MVSEDLKNKNIKRKLKIKRRRKLITCWQVCLKMHKVWLVKVLMVKSPQTRKLTCMLIQEKVLQICQILLLPASTSSKQLKMSNTVGDGNAHKAILNVVIGTCSHRAMFWFQRKNVRLTGNKLKKMLKMHRLLKRLLRRKEQC